MLRHSGEMPTDRIETALVVIAIAVSIQAVDGARGRRRCWLIAWRRARQELDARYQALALRLDEVIAQARDAIDAGTRGECGGGARDRAGVERDGRRR